MPNKLIQVNDIVREMTDEEQELHNQSIAAGIELEKQRQAEIKSKAAAKAALLAQLGITEEQAKLLLS